VIRKLAFFTFIIVLILTLSGCKRAVYAQNYRISNPGKIFLVIIDRISLSELMKVNTPHIDSILEKGGIALMTTNTGGSRTQKDAYLTMGAGTRVAASDRSAYGFQVNEIINGSRAGDIYFQVTGIQPPEGSIVNLGFIQSVRNNSKRPYTVIIGALGSALERAGKRCAVIGNCDIPGEYKRFLVSLMMNDKGIVHAGCIDGSFLVDDHERPFGIRTDYNKLIQIINQLWNSIDVFAIQLGDTSRAEDFRNQAADDMYEKYKRIAIEESDEFIGQLLKKFDWERDIIIIATPLGPANALTENNRLTPVIMAGRGFSNGLLSSGSTKKDGVITNLDIGATILSHYNISPYGGQLGSKVFSTATKMELQELLDYNNRLKEVHNQRAPLLRSYVAVLIVLLSFSLLCIIFYRKYLGQAEAFLQFIMAVPIAYLLLSMFHQSSFILNLIFSWILAVTITGLLCIWEENTFIKIGTICTIITVLLFIDQLTGERMISQSPLGYDIISGARFYGIGNEYMGVIVGAVCTGVGAYCEILDDKKGLGFIWLVCPIFFLVIVMLAYPGLGANVGGTISILAAFASFIILNWKGRIKLNHILAVGIIIAAFLVFLFLMDNSHPSSSQTHMGQTVSLIRENGIEEFFLIAKRKIEMNIKLFRYTIWTRVFLLSLLSMVVLMIRPIGIFRVVADKNRFFIRGVISGIIGCIVALMVNDSGIVAAGTSMIYIAPPALLVIINHLPDKENKLLWKVSNK